MRLLHHKIKNTLQVFKNHVSLSMEDIDVKSGLHHRVPAILAANSLLLEEPESGQIGFAELLRILTIPRH